MHKVASQRNKKIETQIENKSTVPMLSQLFIQLPKPTSGRKKSSACQQEQVYSEYVLSPPNNDVNPNTNSLQTYNSQKRLLPMSQNQERRHEFIKVKRTDQQIIMGWIKGLFQKKNLLGPHWQQKFKKKRFNLLKSSFQRLKEEKQSTYSHYLQTQSKYKPNFKKQNHLILMGLEKLNEAVFNIAAKTKRTVFSKILRFLAFQPIPLKHSKLDSINHHLDSTGTFNSKNNGKQEKNFQEVSPKNVHFTKNVLDQQAITPKKMTKINDYTIVQEKQVQTPVKNVQSAKNLIFSANQYALSPVSPIKQQLTDKKRPRRQSNTMMNQIRISKLNESKLTNSKSQPNQLAIGGVGGNFKYEFNQHNYIVLQPETMQIPHSLPTVNPPSPLTHQFVPTIKFHTPEVRQINVQPAPLIIKQSGQGLEKRDANYIRPHSHNPFITPSPQGQASNNQLIGQDRTDTRKTRSISASGNIKISFMNKEEFQAKQVRHKLNDYQQQNRFKLQQLHKLGSVENKRLRQHYQINSYGNQLIPQDYVPSSPIPNYIYSMPISPKPKESPSPSIHLNYITPAPQSPMTPRSPRGFIYQSCLPTTPEPKELPKQMKQSFQIAPSDYKRISREKIIVTSSHKQR